MLHSAVIQIEVHVPETTLFGALPQQIDRRLWVVDVLIAEYFLREVIPVLHAGRTQPDGVMRFVHLDLFLFDFFLLLDGSTLAGGGLVVFPFLARWLFLFSGGCVVGLGEFEDLVHVLIVIWFGSFRRKCPAVEGEVDFE